MALAAGTGFHVAWASLPSWGFGQVRSWCRQRLPGHEALGPGLEGGDWYVGLDRHPAADPLDMGMMAYGIRIITRDPRDHALVLLTWS